MKQSHRFNAVMLCALLAMGMTSVVYADAVTTLQDEYRAAGAGPFSASAGEKAWTTAHKDAEGGPDRNCQTCHGTDLTKAGKHQRTGKAIDPLAPSANKERLTDVKFIEKWFTRNCKWTVGRECTAQEKGDFLEYLKGL